MPLDSMDEAPAIPLLNAWLRPKGIIDRLDDGDPRPPAAKGPDAELFRRYREYRRLDRLQLKLYLSIDRQRRRGNTSHEDGEAALEEFEALELRQDRAFRESSDAREVFLKTPARTLEGAILKLRCGIEGDMILRRGYSASSMYEQSLCHALADFERLAAAKRMGGRGRAKLVGSKGEQRRRARSR